MSRHELVTLQCVRADCPDVLGDTGDTDYHEMCSGNAACIITPQELVDDSYLYSCGVFKVVVESDGSDVNEECNNAECCNATKYDLDNLKIETSKKNLSECEFRINGSFVWGKRTIRLKQTKTISVLFKGTEVVVDYEGGSIICPFDEYPVTEYLRYIATLIDFYMLEDDAKLTLDGQALKKKLEGDFEIVAMVPDIKLTCLSEGGCIHFCGNIRPDPERSFCGKEGCPYLEARVVTKEDDSP